MVPTVSCSPSLPCSPSGQLGCGSKNTPLDGDGGAVDAGIVCGTFGQSCANGADCCSMTCDPATHTCAANPTTCSPASSSCSAGTDCCSGRCVGNVCSADQCIADDDACTARRPVLQRHVRGVGDLHAAEQRAARPPATRAAQRRLLLRPVRVERVLQRGLVLHPERRRLRPRQRVLRRHLQPRRRRDRRHLLVSRRRAARCARPASTARCAPAAATAAAGCARPTGRPG